jgi:hypothetical protein
MRGQGVQELDVGLLVAVDAPGLPDGEQAGQTALGAQFGDDEGPYPERVER